jgi:hypothetical protein
MAFTTRVEVLLQLHWLIESKEWDIVEAKELTVTNCLAKHAARVGLFQ